VSGPYGMGEYARCAAIARAVTQKWPHAAIHFVLSRAAPYAAGAPFPTTLLASSPTFHSAAVIELMQTWRPQVVLFDNAGRTAQLKAARRLGARIVYISARRRQRGKAFRMRWMRLIDEHWIAYPEFIAGELTFLERLKLKLLRRPVVRYLDVILARAPTLDAAAILSRAGCVAGNYVLVIPGGGTGHPGAEAAVGEFWAAAGSLAARGPVTVFVGPADVAAADASPHASLRAVGALPQADLGLLMRGARLIVANGGSTLLQAIACGAACVAVPIAHDQAERVRRCVDRGVAVASPLEAARMAEIAAALWDDEPARAALAQRAAGLALADGVDVAVRALDELIGPR
jgi:hypothetical protein